MAVESPWVDRNAAAAYLGISPRTLDRWRCTRGDGPPYYKVHGHMVRYRIDELETWAKMQPRNHTSDNGNAAAILRQADIIREARNMVGRRR